MFRQAVRTIVAILSGYLTTLALTAATRPAVLRLAGMGVDRALASSPGLAAGLMVRAGEVVHRGLAADAGEPTPRPLARMGEGG